MEIEFERVKNYIRYYIKNNWAHNSEPMLSYKDLKLVLNELDKLEKAKNYYLKELKQSAYIDDVAVKMYNIMEGNI